MNTKEDFIKQYREVFKDWPEEKLDQYATMMVNKYSTIKRGDNIIHLDYYHGLIDDADIKEIEDIISVAGLKLSRFDKNGVPYNSLQDYTLQVAILLAEPIVQNIILGVATNALWDGIKKSSLLVWRRMKSRYYDRPQKEQQGRINFGLKVRIDEDTVMDLKLEGDVSEATTLQALDKVIDLIKTTAPNKKPRRERFFIYQNKNWTEIDVMEELTKIANKRTQHKSGK